MKRERPFRGIRRPLTSDHLQDSSESRRHAFTFRLIRDDEERAATFYALSETAARELALAWSSKHGWTVA